MSDPNSSFKAQVLLNKKLNGVPVEESNDVIVKAMQEHAKNCLQAAAEEVRGLEFENGYKGTHPYYIQGNDDCVEETLKILKKHEE